jgi:hypothetical protein
MAYRLMTISNGFNGYMPSKMATIGKYAIFSAFSTDNNGFFGPKKVLELRFMTVAPKYIHGFGENSGDLLR